jgi:hypothetical protein
VRSLGIRLFGLSKASGQFCEKMAERERGRLHTYYFREFI